MQDQDRVIRAQELSALSGVPYARCYSDLLEVEMQGAYDRGKQDGLRTGHIQGLVVGALVVIVLLVWAVAIQVALA